MIIPVAHEDMGHRRWPVVTMAIVGACFLVHAILVPIEAQKEQVIKRALQESFLYHAQHPYLKVKPPLDAFIGYVSGSRPHVENPKKAPDSEEDLAIEQERFDAMGRAFVAASNDHPSRKYGYVPARGDILQLITHQFLHGGWMHLIFNMWFLWLCGVNLEDRWGRAIYAPFYFTAGIVGALMELFFGGSPDVARIGASGAVAGAMGAFLIVHMKTRIRFVTFFRLRPVFFTARAYVMLPLWFAVEAFSFRFVRGDQTAHGAHIGGFVFGVAIAFVLRQTGIEKKIDSAIEEKITVKQDPRIVEASELVNQGRPDEALTLLDHVLAESPDSIDVQLEILRAAKAAKQNLREIAAYGRLVQLYIREKQQSTAFDLFHELRHEKRLPELSPQVLMMLAQSLEHAQLERDATDAYEALHQGNPGNLVAVKAMLAQAKIEARIGAPDHARELLTAARESPFSTKEIDDVVDAELAKLS